MRRATQLVAIALVLLLFAWWASTRLPRHESRSVVVVGRVIDPATGAPVAGFRVCPSVRSPDGSGPAKSYDFDDPRGHFRIADLSPGPVSITVLAPGRVPWSWESGPLAGGELRLEVDLPLAQEAHIRVVDQDGKPAPRFTCLKVRSAEGHLYPIGSTGGSSWADVLWLEDGEATAVLPGVPLKAVVIIPGRQQPQELDLDVCASSMQVLTIDLRVSRMFLGCILGAATDAPADEVPEDPSAPGWEGRPGKIWPIDRAVDLRFFSSANEYVGMVQVAPRFSRRFLVTWGDPGPADEVLPTMTLPPGSDIVRAEATAEGYQPMVIPLGAKRRSNELLVILLRSSR